MPQRVPQIEFRLPDWVYTPTGLSKADDALVKEARHEYQRLRRAAQKRLARFEKAGFADTDTYRKYTGKYAFKRVADIEKPRELAYRLSDLRRFLEDEKSSVIGQKNLRNKALGTLHEHGYYFVTQENFQQFSTFMEAARIAADGLLYASDRIAEEFHHAERLGIPPEELLKDFEYWAQNSEELERTRHKPKGKATSAEDYKKTIENRKKRIDRMRKKEGY